MTIVATWLVHCLMIATVLAAAAWSWEVAARWAGRSARWAWLGALAGAVALPWLLRLLPERVALEAVPTAVPMLSLEPIRVGVASSQGGGPGVVDLALLGWAALSMAAFAYVALLLGRLAFARRSWRDTELDGERVYVTRDTGPAALGVVRGAVVVPAWALELDAELRALLLRHEREHVRAGDPRLLLAGLVLLAAMPWNPVLWFALLRLRNAIEMDCDARVLASGVDPERYGSLLLEVGRRRGGSALVMATFAEPRLFLHERIRRIARWPAERRPGRAVLFGVVAVALFATALNARDPLRAGPAAILSGGADAILPGGPIDEVLPGGADAVLPGGAEAEERAAMVSDTPPRYPVFTPMTVAPSLRNREEVARALNEMYPPMLRDGGVGGRAIVWFYIDEQGVVQDAQLSETSGYPALDEAALNVAAMMRFSPALNRDQRVPVWVQLPVAFTPPAPVDGAVAPTRADPRARSDALPRTREVPLTRETRTPAGALPPVEIPPRPAPQAVQVEPELLNREEVVRALERNYPPVLRDAGIGGMARVSVFVPVEGGVTDIRLVASSGYPVLDEAAVRVVQIMRFTPAQRDGRPIATRIELPVTFTTGDRAPLLRDEPAQVAAVARRAADAPAPARVPLRVPDVPAAQGAPPPAQAATAADGPVFTPMTVAPELLNRADVMQSLNENYPPMLREAGIGGRPRVWFHIDETGRVLRTQLSESSGMPALDEAALRVAAGMRFAPALNRDQAVAVWVELPIIFTAR